ncbi:MAG: DUF58 domain-containing protein [Chloroflexi bacterium AL-W]|nr:DUF58 domain-containing protein [Chloroflexi bacterium AL-N1]NOK67007.1 DUF58 domain-containing protein [Chloroflexi bacterium AL-N10]NOK74701.1 DUF58 domain-containing protein [Chloroflexi bacterium AL-N5]NOK81609.1 DUF58 domain-containing protein [Chloroflexi bacterium AL-W]NOK89079.1 DUF58 domain-containing protein [Chloroflexi bacterium AL-N15]
MWFRNIFRPKRVNNNIPMSKRQTQRGGPTSFFRRPQRHTAENTFIVDEDFLQRLERLNIQAKRTLRGSPASGEHPSLQQLPIAIVNDQRPYSAGDDYRHVDWNAYARQEQILIKLGDAEQDIDIHLLADASRSMSWGTPSKLLLAQQLVAALGYLALSHSDRVRITPFSNMLLPSFGPAQGKGRLMDLMQFVENIQPQQQTALGSVLKQYATTHGRGGLLVICSDLLNDAPEALDEGLRLLTPPRWQVLILHLVDPRELQPDLQGALDLEDSETGQRLALTIDTDTLTAYRQNMFTWQEQLANSCARRGATYAHIMTDWPLERTVVPYLRARQILQ